MTPTDEVVPSIGVRALVAATVLGLACSGPDDAASARTVSAAPPTPAVAVHRPEDLVAAAEKVIAFLQGRASAGDIHLADTVMLYISPEGGGARAAVTREKLKDPANWTVVTATGGTVHSFMPPDKFTTLTTRAGRHLNCLEYPLSSRFEHLSRYPHVGAKLEPPGASSCLQSWNLTLVFDPELRPPTIIAAVYDQWEW